MIRDGNEYVRTTLDLMREYGVRIRDTFSYRTNADDFYSNGNQYDGPRLFRIVWKETGHFPISTSNKMYPIPNYQSCAYDAFSIIMPNRYKEIGRDDPIVHECVHFLQHNTPEEDMQYIDFNGENYAEYLEQRVELEAHLIQIAYIARENRAHFCAKLSTAEQAVAQTALLNIRAGASIQSEMGLLILCKHRGLI